MKNFSKKLLLLCLAIALLAGLSVSSFAAISKVSDAEIKESAKYISQTVSSPTVSSIGGEWAVIALARSRYALPQEYIDSYYSAVSKTLEDCGGVLHDRKYTEYSRLIIALSAIGADPTNVSGYNLLTPLGDFEKTVWQGTNGPAWALIALDCGAYEMPKNESASIQASREMYVSELLSLQNENGGWSLTKQSEPDADTTGMVLQALSKYQNDAKVSLATEKALSWLSGIQNANGSFSTDGVETAESTVQVLVALLELGVSLEDSRFVKNDCSVLDGLLSFRLQNGSFSHTKGGASTLMASEQGLYAMAAASRAQNGLSSLYTMDDVTLSPSDAPKDKGLKSKHPDISVPPLLLDNPSFSDTEAAAIISLAERGIINGMGDGSFAPEKPMTRAQFSAIVVRALGFEPKAANAFSDVPAGEWYAPYVGTAFSYGIVSGRGDGIFDPEGTITRQEAAVLVANAAKLCGMDTELGDTETRNILAQFGDYTKSAQWARSALAFCYGEGILDDSALDIMPTQAISRGELAEMVYKLLKCAKLI